MTVDFGDGAGLDLGMSGNDCAPIVVTASRAQNVAISLCVYLNVLIVRVLIVIGVLSAVVVIACLSSTQVVAVRALLVAISYQIYA